MDFFDNDEKEPVSNQDITPDTSYIWSNDLSFLEPQYNEKRLKKALRRNLLFKIAVFAIIFLVGTSFILTQLLGKGWLGNAISEHNNTNIVIPIQDKPKLDTKYYNEETGEYTAAGIAKAVMPSVVSIEIYEEGVAFFPSAQGSGIILTENGYIITNAHVVQNATRGIKVVLNNEDEYQAEIVGSDTKTDLAVIKINAKNLVAADFGDSKQLEIGEPIVALGSPAGLYGSLTKGVVSGLDRMIKTEQENLKMNCIQIDAPINPGNSGGALVNMYGQVVGINSSKFADETYEGIGFAISMNDAKPILEQLIEDGYIKDRVRIGILFYEISEETAEMNDAKPGFYIKEIDPTCDIANSGLKANDIITHINGIPVEKADDVDVILEGKKPGDEVTATVYRQELSGETSTFEIKFKLMEDTSGVIKTD